MRKHMYEEHPGSVIKCNNCGLLVRNVKINIRAHKKSKICYRLTNNHREVCDICGAKCTTCPFTTKTKPHLDNHLKTHTGLL